MRTARVYKPQDRACTYRRGGVGQAEVLSGEQPKADSGGDEGVSCLVGRQELCEKNSPGVTGQQGSWDARSSILRARGPQHPLLLSFPTLSESSSNGGGEAPLGAFHSQIEQSSWDHLGVKDSGWASSSPGNPLLPGKAKPSCTSFLLGMC